MNKFRALALLLVAAIASVAPAQSISVVYDFKSKATTPVTTIAERRLVDNVLDAPWFDIDALILAGASFGNDRKPVGSVVGAIAIQPQLSANWYGQLGLAGRLEAGRPVATGILFGIGYRFRS